MMSAGATVSQYPCKVNVGIHTFGLSSLLPGLGVVYDFLHNSSKLRLPDSILLFNVGCNAAAQDSASHSKGVHNVGRQEPQLRHNLVRRKSGSAESACHRQGQKECCLHNA